MRRSIGASQTEEKIIQAEMEVGMHLAEAYRRRMGVMDELDEDPQHRMEAELVRELGEQLGRKAERRFGRRFAFTLTPDYMPQAFALPGGFVFISRGLLRLIETHREETAFILGHEMGHVIQMHPVKRIIRDSAHGGSMDSLRLPTRAQQWLDSGGYELLQEPYSEERELLADKHAIRLVWACGFDPQSAVRMFERLQRQMESREGRPVPAYFTHHPPFAKRIGQLRQYIDSHRNRPPHL